LLGIVLVDVVCFVQALVVFDHKDSSGVDEERRCSKLDADRLVKVGVVESIAEELIVDDPLLRMVGAVDQQSHTEERYQLLVNGRTDRSHC
jgi:hypothetical protein